MAVKARWLIAASLVAITAAQNVQARDVQIAQLESLERKGSGATVPPPPPRPVFPRATDEAADPSGVWFYVRKRDLDRARSEFERLKTEHPSWQPPNDLLTALAGSPARGGGDLYGQRINTLEKQIRAGKNVSRDLDNFLGPLQRRKDSGAAERFGRALLDTSAPAPAREWLTRAFMWSKPGSAQQTAAINGLVKAEAALGEWDSAATKVAALPPGEAKTQAGGILSNAAAAAAETAARKNDWALAERLAVTAERSGPSRVRTDLGWVALDAGQSERAAASFAAGPQNEESRFGRILALGQSSNADSGPLKSACAVPDRSERAAVSCGDAFAARALTAYQAEDWTKVIALDATAADLGIRRSGTRVLAGWSHFRQKDYTAALTAFDEVAASEPDATDGIIQTLSADGRYDVLEKRAQGNAQLRAAYNKQVGALAMIRKRMTLAAGVGAPETTGLTKPSATIGAFVRDKTGASGADRMVWLGTAISGSMVYNGDRFSGGAEIGHIHVGVPAPGAPVGSLLAGTTTNNSATLASPWVRWDREDIEQAFSITVGTTPIGGEIAALPVIAVSAERNWDKLIGTAILRVMPRSDSLLSMSGLRDSATRTSWGRVVEIGPQLGVIALLSEQWSLSGNISASTLKGHAVAGNSHIAAALSLTYEIKPEGFDYVRVGPSYGFDHYQHNQNFFTLGHGGYYSPDQAHGIGGFVDFLTTEGRSWLLGGRVTASWQRSLEESPARFPLANDGTRFPGQTQSQFGTDSVMRAAALMGPHMILGAYGRVSYAPSGRDMALGLTLSIPFGARGAVFSSDLPHFADRSWP